MPSFRNKERINRTLVIIDEILGMVALAKKRFDYNPDEKRDDDGKWTGGGAESKSPKQIRSKPSLASKTHPRELRRRLRTLQDVHERIVSRLAKAKVATHSKIIDLHDQWNAADTAEKKNKIRDKLLKQTEKLEKTTQEITRRQEGLIERGRKLVEVPKSSKSKNTYQADNSEIGKREDVHAGVALFDRYASRDVDIPQPIDIKDGGDRAHYAGKVFNENSVYVDNSKKPTDFIHEMGHAIEDHHPAIMRESVNFLMRRTLSEKTQSLNDLYSQKLGQKVTAFGKEEVARPDKFHDPYVGKQYVAADGRHYATEILSMGIERLHADPIKFQKEDSDYFDHVINCLRGRYQ